MIPLKYKAWESFIFKLEAKESLLFSQGEIIHESGGHFPTMGKEKQ